MHTRKNIYTRTGFPIRACISPAFYVFTSLSLSLAERVLFGVCFDCRSARATGYLICFRICFAFVFSFVVCFCFSHASVELLHLFLVLLLPMLYAAYSFGNIFTRRMRNISLSQSLANFTCLEPRCFFLFFFF